MCTTYGLNAADPRDEIPLFPKLTLVPKSCLSGSFPGACNMKRSCECLFSTEKSRRWEEARSYIFWHSSSWIKTSQPPVTRNSTKPQGREATLLEQSHYFLEAGEFLGQPKDRESHQWCLAPFILSLCFLLINTVHSFIYFWIDLFRKWEPSAPTMEADREVAVAVLGWIHLQGLATQHIARRFSGWSGIFPDKYGSVSPVAEWIGGYTDVTQV